MKIFTLIEDTCGNPECSYEHGLSIYVETKKHKLLVDTGATSAFIENAEKLGVDLGKVDTVILSHGHYDHSGGILGFCEVNHEAQIYMQQKAVEDYYHDERYIGIDKKILDLSQVHLLNGDFKIDEELFLFTNITGRRYYPKSNLVLSKKTDGKLVQDVFDHEQCLVIRQSSQTTLISGCAHNGILNILDQYQELFGDVPDRVISGFHLMQKTDYTEDEIENICNTAKELKKIKTQFYTGHCTGDAAMKLMKPILGEQLIQIHSGCQI